MYYTLQILCIAHSRVMYYILQILCIAHRSDALHFADTVHIAGLMFIAGVIYCTLHILCIEYSRSDVLHLLCRCYALHMAGMVPYALHIL